MEKVLEAYESAENEREKVQIVEEFLERDTENKFKFRVLNVVTRDMVNRLEDPNAAFDFAEKHLTGLTKTRDVNRANSMLLRLVGQAGDIQKLNEIIVRLGNDLNIEQELDIAGAARNAEAWDLTYQHASNADSMITPESVRAFLAEEDGEEPEDYMAKGMYQYYKAEALFLKGLSQVENGDLDEGLATYKAAHDVSKKNFLGIKYGELNEKWAEALAEKEDWQGVMDILALDALLVDDEKALETYKKAYLAAGGEESELEGHLARKMDEITKEVPDFQAYGYDGSKVSYTDLKSDVTLLAFWFPT
jgi:hypothetical protein